MYLLKYFNTIMYYIYLKCRSTIKVGIKIFQYNNVFYIFEV